MIDASINNDCDSGLAESLAAAQGPGYLGSPGVAIALVRAFVGELSQLPMQVEALCRLYGQRVAGLTPDYTPLPGYVPNGLQSGIEHAYGGDPLVPDPELLGTALMLHLANDIIDATTALTEGVPEATWQLMVDTAIGRATKVARGF